MLLKACCELIIHVGLSYRSRSRVFTQVLWDRSFMISRGNVNLWFILRNGNSGHWVWHHLLKENNKILWVFASICLLADVIRQGQVPLWCRDSVGRKQRIVVHGIIITIIKAMEINVLWKGVFTCPDKKLRFERYYVGAQNKRWNYFQ